MEMAPRNNDRAIPHRAFLVANCAKNTSAISHTTGPSAQPSQSQRRGAMRGLPSERAQNQRNVDLAKLPVWTRSAGARAAPPLRRSPSPRNASPAKTRRLVSTAIPTGCQAYFGGAGRPTRWTLTRSRSFSHGACRDWCLNGVARILMADLRQSLNRRAGRYLNGCSLGRHRHLNTCLGAPS
jgi:hypothetical protein